MLDLEAIVLKCRTNYRVLNRIPKAAIIVAAEALNNILKSMIEQCTPIAWCSPCRLVSFLYHGIKVPNLPPIVAETNHSRRSQVDSSLNLKRES